MSTSTAIMNTYARLPVEFSRGQGIWLYDQHNKAYLDALSGIAVCGLGHAHPAVTEAICRQAGQLLHTSNLYHISSQQRLAERLCAISGMDNVFFCNSGAEANEAAIKMARLFGHKKGIDIPNILVFDHAFHGRTLATLSASGNRKIQAGFEPLTKGFVRAPYDDLAAVETIAKNNPNIVAVLVEPVQGEGGVHIASAAFLDGLRRLCDEHDWLLMLDEVQTGNGRTGQYFAFQHHDWLPDVLSTAKGLGNGIPVGATFAHGKAAGLFGPGNHGSTFGGNPFATSVALATVTTLVDDGVVANAAQMGDYLLKGLQQRLGDKPFVRQIRGHGLMLGIELNRDCGELVGKALEQGLLINVTAGSVIRLLPPLIISTDEADQLLDGIDRLLSDFS
ncbi:MAG TPA: aspartate aminotransferase family protein [Pseudomonadales bacterium]